MGEGWSVGQSDLIPSNGPVNHPDPRMHLKIGTGDLDPCDSTQPKPPPPPPRMLNDRELFAVAVTMARQMLNDELDALVADLKRRR